MKKVWKYFGLFALIAFYFALLILCENVWIAWLAVLVSPVIGYLLKRADKGNWNKRKKWFILFIMIANGLVFSLTRQISVRGAIMSKLLVPVMTPQFAQEMLLSKEDSRINNAKLSMESWEAEGYVLEKLNENGVKLEKIYPIEQRNQKVIMQIHGGAFVVGLKNANRDMATRLSALREGALVVLPDYTTSDQAPYPAAFNDCVATYEWILQQGYDAEDIVIIGDSAGGNLALALGLYLRDHKMPQPAGIITISAFANMKCNTESYYDNADKCVLGEWFGNGAAKSEGFLYTLNCQDGLEDPYLSPVYGAYNDFPKLLMQVGSREIVLDDTKTIVEKVKQAGGDATGTVYQGMWHVFQTLGIDFPEADAAWKEIENFLRELDG